MEFIDLNMKHLLDKARDFEYEVNDEEMKLWSNRASFILQELESLAKSSNRQVKQKCITWIKLLLSTKHRLFGGEKVGGSIGNRENETNKVCWEDFQSAFQRRIRSGVITNLSRLDVKSFLLEARPLFIEKVKDSLNEYNAIKVNTELAAEYIIVKKDTEENEVKYFNTKNEALFRSDIESLENWYSENVLDPILYQIAEFEHKGSGWTLKAVLSLTVNLNKHEPMQGSSYIQLPDDLVKKKACVNLKNNDNQCFKWAILCALYSTDDNRPLCIDYYKQYEHLLNFKGIEFPVTLSAVRKFEKQNDVSVNVFVLKKSGNTHKVSTGHLTSSYKEKHVNLLLLQNYYVNESSSKESDIPPLKFHYVWIKSLSRLVSMQLNAHKGKCYICDRSTLLSNCRKT